MNNVKEIIKEKSVIVSWKITYWLGEIRIRRLPRQIHTDIITKTIFTKQ